MTRRIPDEDEVLSYLDTLSNWGRWGEADQRGTLNLITAEVRRRAAAVVTEGVSVSMALELRTTPPSPVDPHGVLSSVQRFMIHTGQGLDEEHRLPGWFGGERRMSAHTEWLGFAFHGPNVTHLDAFSHVSWDRRLYGGAPAAHVTSWDGATSGAVTALGDGVFTRAVLIDAPRLRGVDWLDASDAVLPADLDAAEAATGVRVEPGDAVILRTGYGRRLREVGPYEHFTKPGWHAACMPWFRERDVALIGSDVACDVGPSGYQSIGIPCHVIALVAMGLPILDECDLEDVADTASRLGRSDFLLTLAPLRIQGATGSPVNPIATF